jgi:hypothetical protein
MTVNTHHRKHVMYELATVTIPNFPLMPLFCIPLEIYVAIHRFLPPKILAVLAIVCRWIIARLIIEL